MTNRTRDYYRKMRKKAINRKERIINSYRSDNLPSYFNGVEDCYDSDYYSCGNIRPYWYVKHKGMLSKGKIYCSCDFCAFHEITEQDKRQLMSMESKLTDYYEDTSSKYATNILTLRSNIRKKAHGVYYPNSSNYPGTTLYKHGDSKAFDYEEFITLNQK
ncbi:hypothetical protein [Lacrimispora amygdalina]|uniref:hypothetical protein n=1 Tax=Lacrimispora amygdalina TaxID=253257 RepID=UPI000BE42452|nr:hypothetical protein [Lacrimispora amygdalina]